MHSTLRRSVCVSLAAAGLLVASLGATRVQSNSRERFTAFAVNVSNVGRAGARPVDITINRWTTDEERDRLVAIFRERGDKALLDALRDLPRVGTISSPGTLGYDLHYARQIPSGDGGRQIVLATDRPIGFWEVVHSTRTLDYPFSLIEMRVNKEGQGEGKLAVAAKLTLNDNVLVIENYANQPVMLNEVKETH